MKGKKTPQQPERQQIHHSDRGIQYYSKEYVLLPEQIEGFISITENGDPYENALAERMNRTVKNEFGKYLSSWRSFHIENFRKAVIFYNLVAEKSYPSLIDFNESQNPYCHSML